MTAAGSGTSASLSRAALDIIASLVMIGAGTALLWVVFVEDGNRRIQQPDDLIPSESQSLDGAALLGDSRAPVVMIQFLDFECPFCSAYVQNVLPVLKANYVDQQKLQLAFRHLPLPNHQNARVAATAAECAREQGRFWELHDVLFANIQKLGEPFLVDYAVQVGLDRQAFGSCMQRGVATRVEEDARLAADLNIESTPLFMLGARETDGRVRVTAVVRGARPLEVFRSEIEQVIHDTVGE